MSYQSSRYNNCSIPFERRSDYLQFYLQLDLASIQNWQHYIKWKVNYWDYDPDNLVYEIKIAGDLAACYLIMTRHSWQENPSFDIIEFVAPDGLYNKNIETLKKILLDWILYGWNRNSTLLRVIKWSSVCLKALEAESMIVSQRKKQLPDGLMVMHNTRVHNADSICQKGLSIRFANVGKGVWTRPPSFGAIDNTRFSGHLTFMLDVSGQRVNRADAHAIVIGEDIPTNRIVRIFDLQTKKDG